MNSSILKEICTLRNCNETDIDFKNSNRYCIVLKEKDGSKSAYYFSTPIYNNQTKKLLDMKFYINNNNIYFVGSNASITIAKAVRIENNEGYCTFTPRHKAIYLSENEIACGNDRIYTTTNGIAYKAMCEDNTPIAFSIEVGKPFMEIRANDKCFCLMSDKFRPFMAISCIGCMDVNGEIIAHVTLEYKKLNDRKYSLIFKPTTSLCQSILFEANLYEPKLFQDTTVESKHPKINNAFGSVAFLGNTQQFEEQWLYSRPDFSKLSELNDKKILEAILHLPKLNTSSIEISTLKVSARFCSFGSTWDKKIAVGAEIQNSVTAKGYMNIDITPIISNKSGKLTNSEGIILRTKKNGTGFCVTPTGDNYFYPQILQVTYQ